MTCRTYVPIRFIAEKLGANVDWEQETKTVTILAGNDRICLQIGSKIPTINSIAMAEQLDAPARLTKGRTYVPLRLTEQDMEFGFKYGQRFVAEGEPRDPNHWFEKYDVKPLSKVKIIGKK
ncbi:MAG: copper amine oxidase N-terminal domain-containing protein [Syntrophomonadaceae bacterium]